MANSLDLVAHLTRQIAFSRATFGPGRRQQGVIDHIRKELDEIVAGDGDPREWVDVVILSLDGLWRSLAWEFSGLHHDEIAEKIAHMIVAKQNRNELRDWPDWRTADPNKAIEHVRTEAGQ